MSQKANKTEQSPSRIMITNPETNLHTNFNQWHIGLFEDCSQKKPLGKCEKS